MDFHRWLREQNRVNEAGAPLSINDAGSPAIANTKFQTVNISIDLSTYPNTVDSATLQYGDLTIAGPAWLEGRLTVSDLEFPPGANQLNLEVYLLSEVWESGEAGAALLYGAAKTSSNENVGGIIAANHGGNRLFIPAGTTARVGLQIQPINSGTSLPVAGQAGGTLDIMLLIAS